MTRHHGFNRALPLLGLSSIMLAGCLSGGGSDSDDDTVSSGVFIDAPVAGLHYATDSRSGETDSAGTFHYQGAETVRFSLAGIPLGSAKGAKQLTPLDIVDDATAINAPAVINLSRFLQSLDADGNLSNGIEITAGISDAIKDYLGTNPGVAIDFSDSSAFETDMGNLLATLNTAGVFAENADAGSRALTAKLDAFNHLLDSLDKERNNSVDFNLRPVLFIHGGAGSASQFESQAMRFRANGYPRSYLAVYEYDTSSSTGQNPTDPVQAAKRNIEINAIVDRLLQISGADKVDLMGHSMGTGVSLMYLGESENAAKVAHYTSIDGAALTAPPGNVPTLALWGQYVDREVAGAENIYPAPNMPLGHIEVATSADSFARIYKHFNDIPPASTKIPEAEGDSIWIAGRASLFPQNTGAEGTELRIFEVDPATGVRLSDTPDHSMPISTDGNWGPFELTKGATYEFGLDREIAGADHYFYREGYLQDSLFVRLNTSLPGAGVGAYLHRSANHTNIMVARDRELWGDQGDENDSLTVNGTQVVTNVTAPLLKRTSSIFLHDRNSDGVSTLPGPDSFFNALPFISGLDLFIKASPGADKPINIELKPRGGKGAIQRITIPNWPSDEIRSNSVQFRDYVQ